MADDGHVGDGHVRLALRQVVDAGHGEGEGLLGGKVPVVVDPAGTVLAGVA